MLQSKTHLPFIKQSISRPDWVELQAVHEESIAEILDPYLEKRQQQHKDPVMDFLFEYYAFRPSHLKKWSPGLGVMLEDALPQDLSSFDEVSFNEEGAFLNPDYFPDHRKRSAKWILSLLENSLNKEPAFGCFGMHEWAMVYNAKNVRHDYLSLRMPMDELVEFVDSRPLVCTHFDAFRFFTDEAKPKNKFELSRDTFAQTEQPGCLHTNMDLYKWAFKMYPWIGSDLIRQTFNLALETRTVDMQASPYDLSDLGLKPIKIETDEGRLQYVRLQKEIYQKSVPLRNALIKQYATLINIM